jgi:hypothetical protein
LRKECCYSPNLDLPTFYGKLRVNGKYITRSFAPIEEYDAALDMLFKWRDDIFSAGENNFADWCKYKSFKFTEMSIYLMRNLKMISNFLKLGDLIQPRRAQKKERLVL